MHYHIRKIRLAQICRFALLPDVLKAVFSSSAFSQRRDGVSAAVRSDIRRGLFGDENECSFALCSNIFLVKICGKLKKNASSTEKRQHRTRRSEYSAKRGQIVYNEITKIPKVDLKIKVKTIGHLA